MTAAVLFCRLGMFSCEDVLLRIQTVFPGQISDEILIAKVAQGNKKAFEILYDRHAAIVLGVCLKLIEDQTSAEHVLQEIFWQVWKRSVTYQTQNGPFTGWLFKITRELATEILKKTE
jgi:RNA polymerase sigma-70 factor, ECF subfamily